MKYLCGSGAVQIGSEGVPQLDDVPPDQVKYPGWNDTRVPEDAECQDTREWCVADTFDAASQPKS